jgi:hypothetical protein
MQPMPLLQATFVGLPDRLMSGEVREAVLELSNQGSRKLSNLCLNISHPSFFLFGKPTARECGFIDDLPHLRENDPSLRYLVIANVGDTVTCLVSNTLEPVQGVLRVSDLLEGLGRDGSLSPGEVVRVPLSIRGDRIGRHLCLFLFAYQSEVSVCFNRVPRDLC